MHNPIHWLEIAVTDLERAKQFYEDVFHLQMEYIEMPDSKMFMFGDPEGTGSSGALVQAQDKQPSEDGTMVYFSCEDLTNELQSIEEAGGQIVVPKTDIGEFGFFAQFIDTEGNKIGLHSQQ